MLRIVLCDSYGKLEKTKGRKGERGWRYSFVLILVYPTMELFHRIRMLETRICMCLVFYLALW